MVGLLKKEPFFCGFPHLLPLGTFFIINNVLLIHFTDILFKLKIRKKEKKKSKFFFVPIKISIFYNFILYLPCITNIFRKYKIFLIVIFFFVCRLCFLIYQFSLKPRKYQFYPCIVKHEINYHRIKIFFIFLFFLYHSYG